MAFTLTFGSDDLLRCRFVMSPLWETQNAVRVLRDPSRHPQLAAWCARSRPRLRECDLSLLTAVLARRGYTPDFIAAPVSAGTPTIDDQLARVRSTPTDVIRQELARVDQRQGADAAALSYLRADPARARDVLADQLEAAWRHVVLPDWAEVEALLSADISYRSQRLTSHGLEGVLDGMHPAIGWAASAISVDAPIHASVKLGGRGLVLQPSVFTSPDPVVILDEPWQPTLVYPARGTATLARDGAQPPATDALARLLGTTRARLLRALDEPAATTALARRHGIAPSTASAHLSALRDAGLVTGRRQARLVLYVRTPLGTALVEGRVA